MEYQKVIFFLDNIPNQLSKFRTKNWVDVDDLRGTYNTNSQIKFKTSMLKLSLCDYSDAYILVNRTITITGEKADNDAKRADGRNKGVKFENCAYFTDCIIETNNTKADNAKDFDVVMLIYNLIEYINN